MNRTAVHIRARSSPSQLYKKALDSIKSDDSKSEFSSKNSIEMNYNTDESKIDSENGINNRVMVVVDTSPEAKSALQWALTHTVQCHDTIVLLSVVNSSQQGKTFMLLFSLFKKIISPFIFPMSCFFYLCRCK